MEFNLLDKLPVLRLGEDMLATDTANPSPARSRREENRQQLIAIVGESDFLSECLAEVLKRRFPDHDVIADEETGELLREYQSQVRLVLIHRKTAAEISRMLSEVDLHAPSAAVGVLIDDPRALDPILGLLADDRHIDGILPLDVRLDVFLAGVDLLVKGGEHFPSALLRRLKSGDGPTVGRLAGSKMPGVLRHSANFGGSDLHESHLTTREVEILDLLCKGTQNKLIAHRLNLSENTIKAHVRNIYKKLRVRNRTEAALRYFDGAPSGQLRHHSTRN